MMRRILQSKKERVWIGSVLVIIFLPLLIAPQCRQDPTGIIFNHKFHLEEVGLECADCHATGDDGEPSTAIMDTCMQCHEIDPVNPTSDCMVCHTHQKMHRTPVQPQSFAETKFAHSTHVDLEIPCSRCHTGIEQNESITPAIYIDMASCMECHKLGGEEMISCEYCHNEISKEWKPVAWKGQDVNHAHEAVWMKNHGVAYQFDKQSCMMCHDQQSSCIACHRDEKPDSHNVAWRRRTHGLQAAYDRDKCATCHEEDYCSQCHSNTAPISHKAGWVGRIDRHCINCHVPMRDTSCTVCHDVAVHDTAGASPHPGFFPVPCSLCHPIGRPGRAPHTENPTLSCKACHD